MPKTVHLVDCQPLNCQLLSVIEVSSKKVTWAEAPYGVRTALHFGLLTARVGGTLLSSPLTLVLAGSQPRSIKFNVKFKSGGQSVRPRDWIVAICSAGLVVRIPAAPHISKTARCGAPGARVVAARSWLACCLVA